MVEIMDKGASIASWNKPSLFLCLHQLDTEIADHNHLPKCCKASKINDPHTPNYYQAMSGEHVEHFQKAMESELDALPKREACTLVPRPKNIKSFLVLGL